MKQQNMDPASDIQDRSVYDAQAEIRIRRLINAFIVKLGVEEDFYTQVSKNALPLDDYYQSANAMVYAKHLLQSCTEFTVGAMGIYNASNNELINSLIERLENSNDGISPVSDCYIEIKWLASVSYELINRGYYLWAMLAYSNALQLYNQNSVVMSASYSDFKEYDHEVLSQCMMDGLNAFSSSWTRYSLDLQTGNSIKHLTMPTLDNLFHDVHLFLHIKECLNNKDLLELPDDEQIKSDLREQLNSPQVLMFLETFEQQNRP